MQISLISSIRIRPVRRIYRAAGETLGSQRNRQREDRIAGASGAVLGNNPTTYAQMVPLLPTMKTRDLNTALQAFRDQGGTLRTRDLIALGAHTDAFYALRDGGQIIELARGLYRLTEMDEALRTHCC